MTKRQLKMPSPDAYDATARYPVIAFSLGYAGSPLSNDYLPALINFASYGYVATRGR